MSTNVTPMPLAEPSFSIGATTYRCKFGPTSDYYLAEWNLPVLSAITMPFPAAAMTEHIDKLVAAMEGVDAATSMQALAGIGPKTFYGLLAAAIAHQQVRKPEQWAAIFPDDPNAFAEAMQAIGHAVKNRASAFQKLMSEAKEQPTSKSEGPSVIGLQ